MPKGALYTASNGFAVSIYQQALLARPAYAACSPLSWRWSSGLVAGLGRRCVAAKEPVGFDPGFLTKRQTLELVRAYYKIENADVRKRLYEFTKAPGAAGV